MRDASCIARAHWYLLSERHRQSLVELRVLVELAFSNKAIQAYNAELVKFAATRHKDEKLVAEAKEVILSAQTTAFESQICRSLKKGQSEQQGSLKKYMSMYADVPPTKVQKHLWAEVQKAIRQ